MNKTSFALGIDLGSSSVKVSIVDLLNQKEIAHTSYPNSEMKIESPEVGWAEQHPHDWWDYTTKAIQNVLKIAKVDGQKVVSIGISYQMHGLVLVDQQLEVIRPAIIWCDSRAVEIGKSSFNELGDDYCFKQYLNSPGNFTASKLKWVKENEPEHFNKIYKMMLPGDYIVMKLTGKVTTTPSGLSEGILWNYDSSDIAFDLLDHLDIPHNVIPDIQENVSKGHRITDEIADELGITSNAVIGYRGGDQITNAISLNVLEPGEIAATGGTSGVVFAVIDQYLYDRKNRINIFQHVGHNVEEPRLGNLLCINSVGILYAWLRKELGNGKTSYNEMEVLAASVPEGSEGLRILPFGNGAERMLNNISTGVQINNLQLNTHTSAHIIRAALEGLAFAYAYGIGILKEIGIQPEVLKVGNDNLFQSEVFSQTLTNLLQISIEVQDTKGSYGAAIAAAVGTGHLVSLRAGLLHLNSIKTYTPKAPSKQLLLAQSEWKNDLNRLLQLL